MQRCYPKTSCILLINNRVFIKCLLLVSVTIHARSSIYLLVDFNIIKNNKFCIFNFHKLTNVSIFSNMDGKRNQENLKAIKKNTIEITLMRLLQTCVKQSILKTIVFKSLKNISWCYKNDGVEFTCCKSMYKMLHQ